MKDAFILVIVFFLGFGSFFGYQYLKNPKPVTTQIVSTNNQPTLEPTLALLPPTQAISGVLTVLGGHTEMFTRTGDTFTEASTGAKILLGESVATKENASASIEIPNILTITMAEKSELVFANLFPNNMVLLQKSGKTTYQLTVGGAPVAIRALHALVSVRSGETSITIVDTDISVTVKTGSVKLALVDNDNNTNVWDLGTGQRATIDDEARLVSVLKTR